MNNVLVRQKVTVYNLSKDEKHVYTNICPFEASISSYMMGNNMFLQISNLVERDKKRNLIRLGSVSASIGDWCVNLYKE